mgnify:CR=1 FL=1
MEIFPLRPRSFSADARFKIDGIVWKYQPVHLHQEAEGGFKIDGIVWKSGDRVFLKAFDRSALK